MLRRIRAEDAEQIAEELLRLYEKEPPEFLDVCRLTVAFAEGLGRRDGLVQAKERGRAACYAVDVTAADAP